MQRSSCFGAVGEAFLPALWLISIDLFDALLSPALSCRPWQHQECPLNPVNPPLTHVPTRPVVKQWTVPMQQPAPTRYITWVAVAYSPTVLVLSRIRRLFHYWGATTELICSKALAEMLLSPNLQKSSHFTTTQYTTMSSWQQGKMDHWVFLTSVMKLIKEWFPGSEI